MLRSALACFSVSGALAAGDFADTVAAVNAGVHGWVAAEPVRSLDEFKALCGTRLIGDADYVDPKLPQWDDSLLEGSVGDLPTDFDAHTAWPHCSVIQHVGSQAGCGDCWAWSATQTFESSLCVLGLGKGDVLLSKQDTAQCCSGAACGYSVGCKAGTPSAAMRWMARAGLVTGGDWNSSQGCIPYALAPCSVDPTDPKNPLPACHEPNPPPTLTCSSTCSNTAYPTQYAADHIGGLQLDVFGLVFRGENNSHIQRSLMLNGPVSLGFTVMGDFPTYRSGIYRHVSGSALGGHAVTLVGWGVEAGTKYWRVKNSWSEYWGENGYFRILRDVNEAGIEGQATGAGKFPKAQAVSV